MADGGDLSTWLTKAAAAAAIGVTEKSVQRFAKAGRLQQAWRAQERGPELAVYNPDDVQRIAGERRPGLAPFVLPDGAELPPANGHGALTRLEAAGPGDVRRVALVDVEALRELVSGTSRTLPPFSTLDEAAAWLHLSKACVRRMVEANELPARRDGRRLMFAARDLKALCE